MIKGVRALDLENDQAPFSNAAGQGCYFWAVPDNLENFYKQLHAFLLKYNVDQGDLQILNMQLVSTVLLKWDVLLFTVWGQMMILGFCMYFYIFI